MMSQFRLSRRSLLKTTLLGAIISGTSQTATAAQDLANSGNWEMYGDNARNTGHDSAVSGPQSSVTKKWAFLTEDTVSEGFAVVDDVVYASSRSQDGRIYALNATDGSEIWSFDTQVQPRSPAVVDGTVYVAGSYNGTNRLYALDKDTGSEIWRKNQTGVPTIKNNAVYIGGGQADLSFYKLNADDGSEQWKYETDAHVNAAPAVANGTVYVGSADDNLYALSEENGNKQWSYTTVGNVSSPVVVDDVVFATAGFGDAETYAFKAQNGDKKWMKKWNQTASAPSVANGTVYVGCGDYNVYALNADDGSERWASATSLYAANPVSIADGIAYVGNRDGIVYAFDVSDGTKLWEFSAGGFVNTAPAISNGTVYVGSSNNNIYALTADNSGDNSSETQVPIPEDHEAGLGLDGSYLYTHTKIDGSSEFVKVNISNGEEVDRFDIPFIDHVNGCGAKNELESRLFITESINTDRDRVVEIDPISGEISGAEFDVDYDPTGICYDEVNDTLWVTDVTGNAVHEYSLSGSEKRVFDVPTIGPAGVAYYNGYLWIGDRTANKVFKYTRDGDKKKTFEPGYRVRGVGGNSNGVVIPDGNGDAKFLIGGPSSPGEDSPPNASFTIDPQNPGQGNQVTFDASDSNDDGTITSYEWDLDDDGDFEKSGQSVTHTFNSVGDHAVALRVTDDSGQRVTTTQSVTVTSDGTPSASFTLSPSSPNAGEQISFDASESSDDGTITSYQWDFDDDGAFEGTGEITTHTFDSDGDYTVTLQVTDDSGQQVTTTQSVTVTSDGTPSASFTLSPSSPNAGEQISFDASESSDDGTITSYEWDFDSDGDYEATGETATYTFDSDGDYTVTLQVTDNSGQQATLNKEVSVSENPFKAIKQAHLETASYVTNKSESGLNAKSLAQTANEEFTQAVDSGKLSQQEAYRSIQRLDAGIGITEQTIAQIGPAELNELAQENLTRRMAIPALKTALNILLAAYSAAKKASEAAGPITQALVSTAKSKAVSAVNTTLKSLFYKGLDAAEQTTIKSNDIISQLEDGLVTSAATVDSLVESAAEAIGNGVAATLRVYDERILLTSFTPLASSLLGGTAGSLSGGIYALYEYLTPERVEQEGLLGDQTTALSAAGDADQAIRTQVTSSLNTIESTENFMDQFSIADSVVTLFTEPNIVNTIVSIGNILLNVVVGGLAEAFKTGAGIGGLININLQHHLGLLNVVTGAKNV